MGKEQDYIDIIKRYGDHFSASEFSIKRGADVTNLGVEFFESFVRWRQWAGKKMLITSAFRPGDPRAHGAGLALDVILFDRWKKIYTDPYQQWLLATTWPFLGVGIYFDWSYYVNKNELPAVGLHVDAFTKDRPVRWLRITKEGKQYYYYQDTKTGQFYNNELKETVRLNDVIKKYAA